ncbi:hypothetical protein F5Y07DRAFT_403610 [Xylaria sp. FL0933]|nr:hypothetical protein F5Y07DRAFT_403610 [Xylaria sp. FL0933]
MELPTPNSEAPAVSETEENISSPSPLEARLHNGFNSSFGLTSTLNGSSGSITFHGDVPRVKDEDATGLGHDNTSRLPLRHSLGIFGCITIFGGSILTLLAIGFLLFLWLGRARVEQDAKALTAWRTIMLHGWATQSVTLTSLLLRVISAAQAGLCTSMVAALLLERRSVPVSQVAQVSVTRSVNGGPMGFLYMMSSHRMRSIALKVEVLLLFILTLTAFALQFSSTILISDFGMTRLLQNSNQTAVNVAISPIGAETIGSFLTVGNLDSSTVLFGEVDSEADTTPNRPGVSDTGVKRRAFLPYQKEDRVNLQHFSGAAFSTVSRTACIRPSMASELSFDSGTRFLISGRIAYNKSLEDAGQAPTQQCSDNGLYCLPATFNCSLPASEDPLSYPQWPTAICHLIINVDYNSHDMPAWDQHSSPFDFGSGFWPALVFATNIPYTYWDRVAQSGPVTLGKPKSYGEWVTHEIEPGKFLNTTLCFSTINATVASLTMTGEISQAEPDLPWNTTTRSYEVGSLQTLFGADATHKTPAQRGILSITGEIQDPAPPSSFNVNSSSSRSAIDASAANFGNGAAAVVWGNTVSGASTGMCDHCVIFGSGVSDDIAALFQHIINTTARAAVAVDTYLAMLSRSWLYVLLPKFDVPGPVDAAFATTVLVPARWSGFAAVATLAVTNTLFMGIITALYVRRTRFTFAGNYWHAISQLIFKDTLPLLEKSGNMKDEDVTEQLDVELEDFLVKIERRTMDDRIAVVRA